MHFVTSTRHLVGQLGRTLLRPVQQRHRVALVSGCASSSKASSRPGCLSVKDLSPPPGARRLADGSRPSATSRSALIMVCYGSSPMPLPPPLCRHGRAFLLSPPPLRAIAPRPCGVAPRRRTARALRPWSPHDHVVTRGLTWRPARWAGRHPRPGGDELARWPGTLWLRPCRCHCRPRPSVAGTASPRPYPPGRRLRWRGAASPPPLGACHFHGTGEDAPQMHHKRRSIMVSGG